MTLTIYIILTSVTLHIKPRFIFIYPFCFNDLFHLCYIHSHIPLLSVIPCPIITHLHCSWCPSRFPILHILKTRFPFVHGKPCTFAHIRNSKTATPSDFHTSVALISNLIFLLVTYLFASQPIPLAAPYCTLLKTSYCFFVHQQR